MVSGYHKYLTKTVAAAPLIYVSHIRTIFAGHMSLLTFPSPNLFLNLCFFDVLY